MATVVLGKKGTKKGGEEIKTWKKSIIKNKTWNINFSEQWINFVIRVSSGIINSFKHRSRWLKSVVYWTRFGLKPQRSMTGLRSYDNNIFQRSVDRPSIMKSTSSDLGTSLNRGIGHHSLWISTIDICGVNDRWVFFLDPKRKSSDHWFFLDYNYSIQLLMFDRWQLEERGKGVNPFISHFRNTHRVLSFGN